MTEQLTDTTQLRHMDAAIEATKTIERGNELQEAAAVAVLNLAIGLEVQEAMARRSSDLNTPKPEI